MRIYSLDRLSDPTTLWNACTLIKVSDLVVVNQSELRHDAALAIFFAMTLKRPIILESLPVFIRGTYPFLKETIKKRLNKFAIANINVLDEEDSVRFMKNVGSETVNYTLTHHETIVGRSYLLARLRETTSDLCPYPDLATL